MIYQIELGYNPYIRLKLGEDVVLSTNETIQLQITSSVYANLALKVFCKVNGETYVFDCKKDEVIDISDKLKAGTLEITIDFILKGELVKHWEIVPIVIKEDIPNFYLKDLLTSLEERIQALEDKHKSIL